MALWQGRSKRKKSGGRYVSAAKKRKTEIGRERNETVVGKTRTKSVRTRGGNARIRVINADIANVMDRKANTVTRSKIVTVIENPANPNYVRRNIITKGAVIQTDIGRARVTSRPGQHGVLNAILIEDSS